MRRAWSILLLAIATAGAFGSSGCAAITNAIGAEKRDVYKFEHQFTAADPAFRRSLENAYFLPDRQVRDALVEAVKRGVEVKVMVPGDQIDLPMVRSASWSHYGELLQNGVRIYEYRPTMMHNKTMAVDGVFSTIGSINFDARSMNRNAEESMAFYDRGFAAKVEAMFNEDSKHCEAITFERWDNRGLPKRLSELVF